MYKMQRQRKVVGKDREKASVEVSCLFSSAPEGAGSDLRPQRNQYSETARVPPDALVLAAQIFQN